MEKASKKRRQQRERNIKMFDQFIRKMRETDHRFSDQRPRISIAPFQRVLAKPSNPSASLATSKITLRRQQTEDTEAVLTGRWWPPPLSTKQADSPDPKVSWPSSPLTKSLQAFQFRSHSAEVPQTLFHLSAEPQSVETPEAAPVEAHQAASSLAVVTEDVDAEADTQGSHNGPVITAAKELGEGYYITPDGFLEAEV